MVAIFAYIVQQNMNWQIFMEIFCLANLKKVDFIAKKFRQKRFQYSSVVSKSLTAKVFQFCSLYELAKNDNEKICRRITSFSLLCIILRRHTGTGLSKLMINGHISEIMHF